MLEKSVAAASRNPIPYYNSFGSFQRGLKALKDHGLPKRLNPRSLAPITGDESARLTANFLAMRWIDGNGAPSDDLKELVEAYGETSWKAVLRKIVLKFYHFVPEPWADLTAEQLREAFVSYVGRDAHSMNGSETFFLALALESDIPLSDRLYLRAVRAHREWEKRAQLEREEPETQAVVGGADDDGLASERAASKVVEMPVVAKTAKLDSRVVWKKWVEQALSLMTDLDEDGMTNKEKDAILTLLSSLQRRARGDRNAHAT